MTGGGGSGDGTTRFVGSGGGGNGTGGGGGGPHRCPKCGANVTFQEPNANASFSTNGGIQNNCFYCAACSGWFLIQPNTGYDEAASAQTKYLLSKLASDAAVGEGGSKTNNGGLPTRPSNRKISQPQFVMQHVSQMILLCLLILFALHIMCHIFKI